MTWLLGIGGKLAGIGGAILAGLLIVWRILAQQKKAGVDQQKAKEAVAREQARREEINRIKDAADAGARVQPLRPGVPNDDPYNLDR